MIRFLVLLLVLLGSGGEALAGTPADEPTILLTELKSTDPQFVTQSRAELRMELRETLAAYLRTRFGSVSLPMLSEEENRCRDTGCAVKIAQRYDASLLIVPAIRSVAIEPSQCLVSLMVLHAKPVRGAEPASREPLSLESEPVACNDKGALQEQLRRLSENLLTERSQLPTKPPPLCRYRYDNKLRGLGLGTALGLMGAGAGLGIGTAIRVGLPLVVSGRPAVVDEMPVATGMGFATMGAGVLLGTAALLPWERWTHGPNLDGCQLPPPGRWNMLRSFATSFFSTSALASLFSLSVLSANRNNVGASNEPNYSSQAIDSKLIIGSGAMFGIYALGLTLSIAIP